MSPKCEKKKARSIRKMRDACSRANTVNVGRPATKKFLGPKQSKKRERLTDELLARKMISGDLGTVKRSHLFRE